MTHFVGLVVAETEAEIAAIVAPYDENTETEPTFTPLSAESIERMAAFYKVEPTEIEALKRRMNDWDGCDGEVRDGVLGKMSTYNPLSKWDWYVVGGRWGKIVPNDNCLIEAIPNWFPDWKPSVLIDAEGWHSAKDFGWFGFSKPSETPDVVDAKLAQHAGKRVWVVDFHI